MNWTQFDNDVKAISCFKDFNDLVTAKGGYRPSLQVNPRGKSKAEIEDCLIRQKLAVAYDLYMEMVGDDRRAFTY